MAVPLDAFTELAGMSLTDVTPETALDKVVRVTRDAVPGAAHVSVTMLLDAQPATAAWSSDLACQLDEVQYQQDAGPCLDAGRGGEIQHVDDMLTETRWPTFAAHAAARRVLGSLSVPLPEHGSVTGALNIYATTSKAFDDTACTLATALAAYGAVSLFNVRTHQSAVREADSIKRAMSSRATIEQAKGILMCRHECAAEDAFEMLVRESQARNVKVRLLAQDVVASVRPGS